MREISKRFGGVAALEGVSLRIEGGRVQGLLGENGAGKSTVMNVLFGLLRADSGGIFVGGKEVRVGSPRVAQGLGIGMVHQHFKLVPTLSVVENFALSLGSSVRGIRGAGRGVFETLKWAVDLEARVEGLSVGQQQRVEIVKALLAIERSKGGGRTLILDEPTAVLTPQETTELFAALEVLKGNGTGIVFISHKLGEVQRICDSVTILRRGKVVTTAQRGAMTAGEMAEKMVGSKVELPRLVAERAAVEGREAALEVRGGSAGMLRDVSLRVMPGEILGIAGVDGNGQGDLVQSIVGGLGIERGSLWIGGEEATRKTIRWRVDRVAYIAEDRHRQAVVLELPIEDNLVLKDYRAWAVFAEGVVAVFGVAGAWPRELVERFDIRSPGVATTVGRLSGGNQQKVVLARELYDGEKRVVVAVNPTRGLDVGATAFVMQQLLAARERGAAVLLVHSDLDELLAISDRVMVMFGGRLRGSDWPGCSKEEIGRLMLGLDEASHPPTGGAA